MMTLRPKEKKLLDVQEKKVFFCCVSPAEAASEPQCQIREAR